VGSREGGDGLGVAPGLRRATACRHSGSSAEVHDRCVDGVHLGLKVLSVPKTSLAVIMKDGVIYENALPS